MDAGQSSSPPDDSMIFANVFRTIQNNTRSNTDIICALRHDLKNLQDHMKTIRRDIDTLKQDVAVLKKNVPTLSQTVVSVRQDVERQTGGLNEIRRNERWWNLTSAVITFLFSLLQFVFNLFIRK